MTTEYKKARKQEKRGMELLGGVTHAGSGSGWSRRNDGHTRETTSRWSPPLLVEFKRTNSKRSITIKDDDLTPLIKRALVMSHVPVLQFEMNKRMYYTVTEEDFLEHWDCEPTRSSDRRATGGGQRRVEETGKVQRAYPRVSRQR